jgi:acyl-CoA hydrolase
VLDVVGEIVALHHARKPVVTAAIDRLIFLAPVYVGTLVAATASLTHGPRRALDGGTARSVRGTEQSLEQWSPDWTPSV